MPDARWNDPREYDDWGRGDVRPRVYGERDRDDHDPRDSLIHDLDLPRGDERELVVDRDRLYEMNGEDSRALIAVGTFRVVPEHDLDTDRDTVRHLRDEGLVETVRLGGDERGVTLTKEGRDLLDSHTVERESGAAQAFHAGVRRPREIDHDANLYATFCQEEARLRDEHPDLEIRRVVLEQDLKRKYQEFLQDHNRNRSDSDGRPDRTDDEICDWAREHDLPYCDRQVCTSRTTGSNTKRMGASTTRTASCSRPTTAALMPPVAGKPVSESTSSGHALAAVVPGRIRASWRTFCDARIPAQSDIRQRERTAR